MCWSCWGCCLCYCCWCRCVGVDVGVDVGVVAGVYVVAAGVNIDVAGDVSVGGVDDDVGIVGANVGVALSGGAVQWHHTLSALPQPSCLHFLESYHLTTNLAAQ